MGRAYGHGHPVDILGGGAACTGRLKLAQHGEGGDALERVLQGVSVKEKVGLVRTVGRLKRWRQRPLWPRCNDV